jgi:hypothetical protein
MSAEIEKKKQLEYLQEKSSEVWSSIIRHSGHCKLEGEIEDLAYLLQSLINIMLMDFEERSR